MKSAGDRVALGVVTSESVSGPIFDVSASGRRTDDLERRSKSFIVAPRKSKGPSYLGPFDFRYLPWSRGLALQNTTRQPRGGWTLFPERSVYLRSFPPSHCRPRPTLSMPLRNSSISRLRPARNSCDSPSSQPPSQSTTRCLCERPSTDAAATSAHLDLGIAAPWLRCSGEVLGAATLGPTDCWVSLERDGG